MRQDDRVKQSNKAFPVKKYRGKDSKVWDIISTQGGLTIYCVDS